MRDSSRAVHGYEPLKDLYGSVLPPVYFSAVYEYVDYESAAKSDRGIEVKYSREENPTVRALERALAALEEGEDALAFASGMAAISTVLLSLARKGLRVLILKEMYGTTVQLVEELSQLIGYEVVKAYPSTEAVEEAIKDVKPDVALIEPMTNPTLKVLDLKKLSKVFRDFGVTVFVDNTLTTPVLLRPLKLGAAGIIHSTTKYLSGHNDALGGAVIGSRDLISRLWEWRRKLGNTQQPMEAYLTLRGVKTLELRVARSSQTAMALAEFLQDHRAVEEVLYPGLKGSPYHEVARSNFERELFGGVLSFKVRGGLAEAKRVLSSLKLAKPAPSLGGAETLVTIPALTASSRLNEEDRKELGITNNLIRVSVGLEDPEDLIEDFDQALRSIA